MARKSIVFDFDGVIHKYSRGWQDGSIYDEPVSGIKEVINELHRDYDIYIVTTRARELSGEYVVKDYLDKHGIEYDMVTSVKVPAIVYVDDRALTFNPENVSTLVKSIKNFQPWRDIPKNKLF